MESGDRVMGRTSGYLSIIKQTLSSLLSTLDLSLDFHLPQTDILLTFGLRCEMTLHCRLFRTTSAPWIELLTSNEMLGNIMVAI